MMYSSVRFRSSSLSFSLITLPCILSVSLFSFSPLVEDHVVEAAYVSVSLLLSPFLSPSLPSFLPFSVSLSLFLSLSLSPTHSFTHTHTHTFSLTQCSSRSIWPCVTRR